MKKIVCIGIILCTFQVVVFSQCGINYKVLLDKYCNGVYLRHQELDNASNGKMTFMFKKDDRYAIYLLNPSRHLPDFTLTGSKASALKDVVSNINKKEKVSSYVFTAGETGEFEFSYNFNTQDKVCVLMAIYLQNLALFQPGIYSNFEEMKYNNPSTPINNKIYSRVVKLDGSQQVTFYRLEMNKTQTRIPGKPFGFSDGKFLYIKQKEGTGLTKEFVKLDSYGKYGYFEDIAYLFTGTVTFPYLTYNVIDMNSGAITRIDKKHLRELLTDDPMLLEAFNHESQKDNKIKEYLVRYLNNRNAELNRLQQQVH